MFVELNNLLNFTTDTTIDFDFIGVCEKQVESGFVIHHFVSFYLKKQHPVFLTSFCQSFNHYNTIGNKIGSSLTKARDSKQLVFTDGVRHLGNLLTIDEKGDNPWKDCLERNGRVNLQPLYSNLNSLIQNVESENVYSKPPVLVIDGVSMLLSIGVSVKDIVGFLHYCRTLASVVIVSLCTDEQDEDGCLLWKFVQHMSSLTLAVSGLDTGYCRDVHGELTVTWRRLESGKKMQKKKTQFKLTDKSVQFFAAGMSSAVL